MTDITSTRIMRALNFSLNVVIVIFVVIIAISKITKKRTFGFVLTAVLVISFFSSYMSNIFGGGPVELVYRTIQYDSIKSSQILLFPLRVLLIFWFPMHILLLIFSVVLLINFLFHLKRDPKLIPIENNGIKPLSGETK
jgi:hypothetical protein